MDNNEELLKQLKSRFEQMDSDRNRFTGTWQDMQKYVMPKEYNFSNLDAVPDVPKRYSSSACAYLQTLVSGLAGYSISPNISWFKLSLENQQMLSLYGVKDWLESCETVMLAEFNRSNLYQQAVPLIRNAAGYGHGVLLVDEDKDGRKLRFTNIRVNELYLDVDESGTVDTVFRRYIMTVRNAVRFFGLDTLDENIQAAYKEVSRWNEKIEILFCVYPREKYRTDMPDSKNFPYAAVYIDNTHNKIISESGYQEFPYAVFEWEQDTGLAYSASPAINALPTIKELEIEKKTSLQICQTSANPPMLISEGLNNVSLLPSALNRMSSKDDAISPIKTGENYPVTLQILQQTDQSIRDWFFVDFFLMLEKSEGTKTATEVMEMQGEKAATLSSIIVSLNETLKQIISRSFNLIAFAGRLPQPPQSLMGQRAQMKIDYTGPLAIAQKKYHTSGGIAAALGLVQPIVASFPQAADFIDSDELIKRAMEGQGMPQAVIREDDDVKDIRKARAQAQAQAAQQAQMQQLSQNLMQNANKMNEPVKQGSMLQDLNSQLAGSMGNGNS